jgi:lipoprotein-anchoring transpeptidase ErfK/SrfK
MKKHIALIAAAAFSLAGQLAAAPAVNGPVPTEVVVDLSEQTMAVYLDGSLFDVWPVSTARPGKVTPRGKWSPNFLSRHHRSSLYNNAPMPFSIFYNGNFAIHGTNQTDKLGSPASSGCVRLDPKNAELLFDRVEQHGLRSFRVTVID